MEKTKFEKLNEIDVNKYTEKKNGLTYLSWTYAWKEFKKEYPNAIYQITHWDGCPYWYDEKTGYMCETTVDDGEGMILSMWLPVMDSVNHALKDRPYTIKTRNGDTIVPPATMFDINKTIMRCLVKNIAMFGLGLYIYAGEDLPDGQEKPYLDMINDAKTIDELTTIYLKWSKVFKSDTDEFKILTDASSNKKSEIQKGEIK